VVASTRDWVIIIVGILEIILLIGLLISLFIIYRKVNNLINKIKETVHKIENMITSPYFKVGAFLVKTFAPGFEMFHKKEKKEGKANG